MAAPRVSVLMTNYNGERFLASAIVSILEQSYKDFELIVVDDGSTDSSPAILRAFVSQDSRIKGFYFPHNRGFPCALNYGLARVRGEYVARMDSDDLCHRDRLAKQVSYLEKHHEIFVLGCRSVNIDEWDKRKNNAKDEVPFRCGRLLIARRMAEGEYLVLHASLMIRKFCLEELGGYREIFPIGEDIDLYARLFDRYGAVFENLSERLYSYRRYKESLTGQHNFSQHAWVQTLVMYSARCRREGRPDPLDKARSLRLSSLPVSSSERSILRAWHFFHRLYILPRKKEERSIFLRRGVAMLKKNFGLEDARRFPYPYLQLARASARSGDLFLFLRLLAHAWRSDHQRTNRLLLRKVVFLLKEFWEGILGLEKHIFCARKKSAKESDKTSPRVSVVMTTYNRVRYLSEAIASWQRQTLSDFELVVVDDGSNDSTKKLLRACARYDRRIRPVFLSRNYGIPYAANRGLEVALAPLIARADSDDIASPHRLQRQALYMDDHPRVVALGCLCAKISTQGKYIGSEALLRFGKSIGRALKQGACPLLHPTVMLRTSGLPVGGYRIFFKVGAEDIDLFLRMQEIFVNSRVKSQQKFDNISDVLMLYRYHPLQNTRRYKSILDEKHACALFSARRRARGLSDPLSDNKISELESLQKLMTEEERSAFKADVAAQQLLSAMARGDVDFKKIIKRVRCLRTESVDKGRFVWVALSAARHQEKLGFYVRSLVCLWEGLRCSPLWTIVTLYDVIKTRRYVV